MTADTVFAVRNPEGDIELRVDGSKPLTVAHISAVESACAAVEAGRAGAVLPVYVSGTPGAAWTSGMDVALVSKWERSVRRLERLGVATVAIASGECGGMALDALLATDFRIATPDVRLSLPVDGEATWPGMAVFRLVQQAGAMRLRRAILFGTPVEASEGVDLGLLDEVTDDPAPALAAVAARAAALTGSELAVRRRLMADAATTSFDEALGRHLAACDRALRRSAPKVP